jgi:peptide/nickel transport system ATP-binding protein
MSTVIDIRNLTVEYSTGESKILALAGADLAVARGETVGIVGESGSGKSTLALAVGRLLPPNAQYSRGEIIVEGEEVLGMSAAEVRDFRRRQLGFIPQDPISALNPTMRIGRQIELALRGLPNGKDHLIEHLEKVRIRQPERVLRLFPHEVSGGMAQRIVIAMTMARFPRILIADEPTAALDTSVRNEVTDLIFTLAREAGSTMLWLSHDLRNVGRWCKRTAVMYAGRVVEDGETEQVLNRPTHPYTVALAAADPARARQGERIGVASADFLGAAPVARVRSDTASKIKVPE